MGNKDRLLNNKGISLLEIIVSLGLLALVLVPTLSLFASSILNVKVSRDSIDAKYLAEKYMEIVKGVPIDGLGAVLAADCGFAADMVNECVYRNDELGVTVEWRGIDNLDSSNGLAGLNYPLIDVADLANTTPDNVHITINSDLDLDFGLDTRHADIIIEDSLNLLAPLGFRFVFRDLETVFVTYETNYPARKYDIYCVNYDDSGNVFESNVMPEFTIIEGRVAVYDYTVSNERLPGEEVFGEFFLAYEITITVSYDDVYYKIQGIKSVN